MEIAELVAQSRRVVEGDTSVAVPEIMRVGASAGGARAKAVVLWNRVTNVMRSGFAVPQTDDEPWLIKFDGVSGGQGGHTLESEPVPGPYCRIEYAFAQMARAAGIRMSDVQLLPDGNLAHFAMRRFDRPTATDRLHMHSLAGMDHVDYNQSGAYSYEQWFTTIRALGLSAREVEEAYRRMVFNYVARNQDDHVKNHSFLMTPDGAWQLAPAYDVTWAVGRRWAQVHQMTMAGKQSDITRDDLLSVGHRYDIPGGGKAIIEAVVSAVDT